MSASSERAAFAGLVVANLSLAYATAATGAAGPFHRSRLVFWVICAIAGAVLAVAYATPSLARVLGIAMPVLGIHYAKRVQALAAPREGA